MADWRAELDTTSNIVLVMVTEDDGSEHDYQFDFDPRTGRWEFAERDLPCPGSLFANPPREQQSHPDPGE